MTTLHMNLHWQHAAGAAVLLLLLLLSVVFAGKYRTAWLACLSILCMAAVAGLWIRNWSGNERDGVLYESLSPASELTQYWFQIQSTGGSLRSYYGHQFAPLRGRPAHTEVVLICQRDGKRSEFIHQVWSPNTLAGGQLLGFGMYLESLPPQPAVPRYNDTWALMLPSWFVLLALTIFPARWLYMHKWGRKAYARKHNLCLHCGYCLNGLPEPVRCPECGTPRETAPRQH